MRRRSKRKYTWFPILGTRIGNGETQYDVTFAGSPEFGLRPQPNSGSPPNEGTVGDSFIQPLTADATVEESGHQPTSSLRDIVEGQDWLLKRIVGNIFVAAEASPGDASDLWPAVLCTVGIFVARAQDDDQNSPDFTTLDEFDPTAVNNSMNPWVWRRTWLIGNSATVTDDPFGGTLPANNMAYGDMRSGPHIDSKVSRRITKEHRLWLTARVVGYAPASIVLGVQGSQFATHIVTDLRILGALRKGKNRSSF